MILNVSQWYDSDAHDTPLASNFASFSVVDRKVHRRPPTVTRHRNGSDLAWERSRLGEGSDCPYQSAADRLPDRQL